MNDFIRKSLPIALVSALAVSTTAAQDRGNAMTSGNSASGAQQQGSQSKPGQGASAAATGAGQQGKQAGSGGGKSDKQAVLVLVPVKMASTDTFANGCWARLYGEENYGGDVLSLVGPVDVPNSRPAAGFQWGRKFDSVIVGPKAQLTVFDNENYQQKTATFKPNAKVADLDEKMGFFENIRSMRINCTS